MTWITLYLLVNCLFLAYIRLKDTAKLQQIGGILGAFLVVYIGLLALPLTLLYWIKNKIFKYP